jgi:hypothetical protein
MNKPIVIGCGAGFSADRLDPAVALAKSGRVEFLVFECVGERTLAFGHRDRMLNPNGGYNPLLAPRLRALLPVCQRAGTRIVTNMGAANPKAAAEAARDAARALGIKSVTIAYVEGDEVTALLPRDCALPEIQSTIGDVGMKVVGANAYLGIEHLLPAIRTGADVVIVGRFADPSLFLAPIADRHDWQLDDWDRLARGTAAGHLLECGMQVTGGYFADPPYKTVPDLAYCGFPLAEVDADGGIVVTKLAEAGGCVTQQTVKEQLLYEVHDPGSYLTPDVTADFSHAVLMEQGRDRVAVTGIAGKPRPARLKVTVGFDGGFQGEGGISYAGPGAGSRAALARDILHERLGNFHRVRGRLRIDLIGMASLHATAGVDQANSEAMDVRVHVAFAAPEREQVELVMWEVESLLCCGPAGGGGFRGQIVPKVITYSAFVERSLINAQTRVIES